MTNWASSLFQEKQTAVLENIHKEKFYIHQHVCADDTDVKSPGKIIKHQYPASRKLPKPSEITISYSKPKKNNTTGVRGVYCKKLISGDIRWESCIQHNGIYKVLYYGPNFDEAVEARRKAEEEVGGNYKVLTIKKKNDTVLPAGVTTRMERGKRKYIATTYVGGKCLYLYHGESLDSAISARKQWEKENGFANVRGKRCYKTKTNPNSRNKSGVVGVSLNKGKHWVASACRCGIRYVLYHGPSKIKAINARKLWEKDNTKIRGLSYTDSYPKNNKIYKLFNKNKFLTTKEAVTTLGLEYSNASYQLKKMYEKGYLAREESTDIKGHLEYIYRRI